MKFKDMLKQEREKRGWTQPELAKRAGISDGTISNLEVGKNVYQSTYDDLCKILPVLLDATPPLNKAGRPVSVSAPLKKQFKVPAKKPKVVQFKRAVSRVRHPTDEMFKCLLEIALNTDNREKTRIFLVAARKAGYTKVDSLITVMG